jgi:uncharacterized protein YkwD
LQWLPRGDTESVMPRHQPHALAAVLLSALLAACGGGGGGGGDDDRNEGQAPQALAGNDGGSPAAAYDCGLPGFQAELLQRVNSLRASGAVCGARGSFAPAAALAWNDVLTQAALGHAADMAAHDHFSHTSLDGSTLAQRVSRAGYAWSLVAENIAAGQPSVQSVMASWIASDGHCANLMNPGLHDIGLACVPGSAGARYGTYWTMNLAAPR